MEPCRAFLLSVTCTVPVLLCAPVHNYGGYSSGSPLSPAHSLPSLLAPPCPLEIFVFFLSNFSPRGSRVVQSELPLFIVISWDNEQMTCHLEHLEPGVKLGL